MNLYNRCAEEKGLHMQLISRSIRRSTLFAAAGILVAVVSVTLAQRGAAQRNVDYPFSGNAGSQRFSTLTQFPAQNVGQLKESWRYALGGSAQIQNQPVVVAPGFFQLADVLCGE